MSSGEAMNYVIPLEGGCGGPYVLKVISGHLPKGLALDSENHAITGYLGEDGDFSFTVEVTDTGCSPFSATTATFSMHVGVGEVTIVAVKKDGNPAAFTPPGEAYSPADERPPEERTPYNPDYPALPETIFNEFTLVEFVIAGGVAPYSINLADLSGVPDGPLPLGTSLLEVAASISGTPIEEAEEGAFLLTFEVTDAVGNKGTFTAYWLVYSPPLYIATDSLGDGVCGQFYADQITLAGGIPPFNHAFVEGDGSTTKVTAAMYPAQTAGGPDYSASLVPSEGMYLEEDTGRVRGVPRRRGSFSVWYHVNSTLLPFSSTQNRWRQFGFYVSTATAPLMQDGSYTLDGPGFATSEPYNRIADIEVGKPYNPDSLTHTPPGLQALASGGVPYDDLPDHPHWGQIQADSTFPGEVEGTYNWSINWGPDGPIPATEFTVDGIFRVTDASNLVKQNYQNIQFTAIDQALPLSQQGTDAKWVRVSIGPDEVIVTTSTTSFSGGSGSTSSQNGIGMDDREITVQLLLPYKSGAELKTLNESRDMAGKGTAQHSVPSTAGTFGTADPLATILTDIDFLRVSVNPNGWWNDTYNLNPRGARGMQHGDANRTESSYHGNSYVYSYSYKYQYTSGSYSYSYSYSSAYGAQPETSAVHLPEFDPHGTSTASVAHDPDAGVYTDGGKMYCFDGEDYFGVFIIRDDGSLYVPVAIKKSQSVGPSSKKFVCFGDNVNFDWDDAPVPTVTQMPQMSVSPDGRVAAMKLMTDVADYSSASSSSYGYGYQWTGDSAYQCGIVLFSLTGERLWSGDTYKIIDTGSNGTSSYGLVMKADTMTLTNSQLYYLCSNRGYRDAYSWREQFVYRYDVFNGGNAGAMLEDGNDGSASDDPEWTQEPGEWMQLPSGRLDNPVYSYSYSYGYSSSSYSYSYTYSYNYANSVLYDDGAGWHEGSTAPVPFRVNADGNACVIIAGEWGYPYSTSQSSSPYGHASWHQHHVFLDYDNGTGPTLYRLSDQKRRVAQGTGRGYKLADGYRYYTHHWGARCGPTPGVEISDDGSKVAVCVSRVPLTTSIFGYNSYSYSSYYGGYNNYGQYAGGNWTYRQDVILFEPKDSSGNWTSTGAGAGGETTIQVTGADSGTPLFYSSIRWRFGSLVFTKENDGLIFWGGYSSYSPTYSSRTSSQYYDCMTFVGSFYSYEFSSGDVANVLPYKHGGANLTVGSAQTSIGSTMTSARNTNGGVIKPIGGFISKNREYLYVATVGALNSSMKENLRLIGININSLDGSSTGNGRYEGEGFAVGATSESNPSDSWPDRRGFTVHYGSSSYPSLRYGYAQGYQRYAPGGIYGSEVVMAGDSGWVFFGSHYQSYGGSSSSTSAYYPFLPTYTNYSDYGPYRGQVAVFDADVGGDVFQISGLTENSSSSYTAPMQFVKYIEPTPDGHSVAYVYATNSYYYYVVGQDQEKIGYVSNINLDETTGDLETSGALDYDNSLKSLNGGKHRVCSSVAHNPFGDALYFAYGSGNEATKTLYKRGKDSSSNESFGLPSRRWNVLHAAR